jgi:peroxiredoxin
LHAQVLGISVDWNGANKAWAQEMGVTYPLLSDLQRLTTSAYGVLYDDPKLAETPKTIPVYLRAKGSWFVIDKTGVIRATKIMPVSEPIDTAEILQALQALPEL